MACVTEVAKYIIKNCCVDNLKLQKLLYYSQGVFMVLHEGNPLFEEAIEAWDYGPVVNCIYHKYKSNGFDRLQIEDSENSNLTQDEMSAIDMVLEYYGEFSGAALINRTHSEEPWKSTYVPNEAHRVIPKEVIYKYFKQNVEIA